MSIFDWKRTTIVPESLNANFNSQFYNSRHNVFPFIDVIGKYRQLPTCISKLAFKMFLSASWNTKHCWTTYCLLCLPYQYIAQTCNQQMWPNIFVFCVVILICLSSSGVLCTQWCQCLWIFHSWLPLRFSLTFIWILKLKTNLRLRWNLPRVLFIRHFCIPKLILKYVTLLM
jgi:hypothetical protein